MPGYKAAKDRLALLFGGNASDIKLRPLLVYHSEKPRALKNIARGSLPIVWKSNPKAWVTQGIFQDWFFHHSIPKGEKYYLEDVPLNILLWLDSAPGHSPLMDSFHAIFKAVHLPLNTVLLTQPVNHYSDIQEIFLMPQSSSGSNVNDESGTTLKQFWKDSNIYKAIIVFFFSTSLGVRLLLSLWMGFGRTFAYNLFMIFLDLRRQMRSSSLAT